MRVKTISLKTQDNRVFEYPEEITDFSPKMPKEPLYHALKNALTAYNDTVSITVMFKDGSGGRFEKIDYD